MTEREEQRGQEVHGPQTNIGGDVQGPVLSGHFEEMVNVYSRSQVEALNDHLAQAVAAYEARMYQHLRPPTTSPDQPYKFLYAFEIEDAPIFFGREAASEALHETVLQDRMTVLHARSGAGKTSLLKAGLSPRLIREGRLPVYARAYEDPVLAVKQAIAPPSSGPWLELLPNLSLHEFLGLACKHLKNTQELVIILDQFEEFFIFCPERVHRRSFIDALADCYNEKILPVRFVIAIRSDYFSQLATFQHRLHHIFHNEYYLSAMSREDMKAAIINPTMDLSNPVAYEQALVERLLDDLARGGMDLPHMQIVCSKLYEDALAEGKKVITLESYENLGWVEGVLTSYLNDVLDRLPGREVLIAKEILKELVSSEATKRVLSCDTLVARIKADRIELENVLSHLVSSRLLRRDEDVGEFVYEMAHEYLVEEIMKWIDQAELEFKQAQELLAREVANWRVYGALIPRDRLEVLHSKRDRLKLDDDARKCLLLSALEADFAVKDWGELAGEVGEKPFLEALNDSREEIRRSALQSLGAIWGLQQVSRLGDVNWEVRRSAVNALRQIDDPRVVRSLIASLQDENETIRTEAILALGKIGDPQAIGPLVIALEDSIRWVRDKAREALRSIDNPLKLSDPRRLKSLITVFKEGRGKVHQMASRMLVNVGEPAVEPLVAILNENQEARQEVATMLVQIGAPAVDLLVATLRDESVNLRLTAIESLGAIGDPRAVEPLIFVLQDENRAIRLAAIRALRVLIAAMGDKDNKLVLDPLVDALRDKNPSVRLVAIWLLGAIRDPKAVQALISAMWDENDGVSERAVEVVVDIGKPSVKPLITALCSADKETCRIIREALVKIGEPAVQPLIIALQARDNRGRQEITKVMAKIGMPAVNPLVSLLSEGEKSEARQSAAEALGRLGKPNTVEPLLAALRDRNSAVRHAATRSLGALWEMPEISGLGSDDRKARQSAARKLGRLGDPRAIDPLVAALKDQNSAVRRSATKSLGALWKLPEVSRLGSDEGKVRRKAARELGELGDPRAVAPLIAALKDQSKNIIGQYYVQEASAEALKIIGTSEALAALDTDNDEGGIK